MLQVLDWCNAADPDAIIRCAAQTLAEGGVVAFPTETVYGLAASPGMPNAIERLRFSKGRPEDKPLTLTVSGVAEALEWVPEMSVVGRRLARRCWPGPVTLVFGQGIERGRAGRLPENVRQFLCPAGTLGLRVPDHDAILQTMALLQCPLVLTSANKSGQPAAITADEVVDAVGDQIDLVINDGPSPHGQASTVVQVEDDRWHILREGVVAADEIRRRSACWILFLCTGNTCRSPLAEGLFKKCLAERVGCKPAELPQHGFVVLSAGLSAMMGGSAAAEAIEVAREYGVDLSSHQSRPLTADLAEQVDYLIAMTLGHVLAVASHFTVGDESVRLLSPEGEDIDDPVGCDRTVYQMCAQQIWNHLENLAAEIFP